MSHQTVRAGIIELLLTAPQSARDLSQQLHISEKELPDHLDHIRLSVKASGRKLVILPFSCLNCGFRFKDRGHFKAPGRCPQCRNTHIEDPLFALI